MNFADLHCDTAGRMYYEKLDLKESICKVDIKKLKKGKCLTQVFAIFVDQKLNLSPFDEFMKIYNNFIKEVNKNSSDIQIVKSISEMNNAHREGKIPAFMSIEEGEVLEGKVENLKKVYDLGVRILTVTWNYKNKLGYPNFKFKYQNEGLTETGIEVIKECEKIGIIPDASHLSDGGFYDLIKICKKPLIASHSNARSITNHPRNLTDNMIKLLADKGGVMGLNFCSDFLGENNISTVQEIVCHAKHIRNVGGIDVLCLGSDFDGILNEVEIEDSSQFYKLYDGLKDAKFTDDEIEKIFYKNVIRVFSETL